MVVPRSENATCSRWTSAWTGSPWPWSGSGERCSSGANAGTTEASTTSRHVVESLVQMVTDVLAVPA